jgi:hypothetical protein
MFFQSDEIVLKFTKGFTSTHDRPAGMTEITHEWLHQHLLAGSCLVSAILPKTIKAIGPRTFVYQYSLKEVHAPGVTTIGEDAFLKCISLPEGLGEEPGKPSSPSGVG